MNPFIGELAALGAAFGFSITSVCYTLAGRKVNAVAAIAVSLPISWAMIVGLHQLTLGVWFPANVALERWFFLSASGILAYVVSSYFMLNAYQRIGPRLTMLIAAFAPALGALLAWLFLGQSLPANATIGVIVVLSGILWVVAERGKARTQQHDADLRRGVILACLGTLAQGTAFVFASKGVAGDFPPFSATLIRITAGILALWAFIVYQGSARSMAGLFASDRKLLLQLAGAALSGPVLSGTLLLLSFQFVPVGVSTTLSHTTAIMLIPIGYLVFHERITARAITGTLVTIIGIGILFS